MKIPSCGGFTCRAGLGLGPGRPVLPALLPVLALLLAAPAARADYPLEILEPRARPPEELVPILAPLAGPDGTVVAGGNALFVRASPGRLADIRRALAELDRPPRSLLIQVRRSGSGSAAGAGADVRIDERLGDPGASASARVRSGPPGPGGSGARLWAGQRSDTRDIVQEVRTLDGRPAFIAVGEERPLPYREIERDRTGTRVREGTLYRSADTGFYVTPRVVGDRVVLEIASRDAAPGPAGSLRTGEIASRIEAPLGDWIDLGSAAESATAGGAGLLYGAQSRSQRSQSVEVRVLPLTD